jgi:hypothetical protein
MYYFREVWDGKIPTAFTLAEDENTQVKQFLNKRRLNKVTPSRNIIRVCVYNVHRSSCCSPI